MLTPYGEVKAPRRVAGEVREIDVWFAPKSQSQAKTEVLGLLGRIARTPAIIEPFRNAATSDEICDCLLKLLEVRGELQREANRNKTKLTEETLPKLWIITPTASPAILSGCHAMLDSDWLPGVYFMGETLRTAIVVIHQLPRTAETLWLRILGKGAVQKQAIDELEALPEDNTLRSNTLRLLYNLRKNLEVRQDLDESDRELIMRLAPLYQRDREQAMEEGERRGEIRGEKRGEIRGIQQGKRFVVENLLQTRFGSLDEELRAIIEPLLALPSEDFTSLLLQLSSLSRSELLARFRN
ncbi:MAG: hypothetical protein AB4426_15975 [Xenococcaceae cyanobacterium]